MGGSALESVEGLGSTESLTMVGEYTTKKIRTDAFDVEPIDYH